MTSHPSHRPVSALRERMIEDMAMRGFSEKTRHDYIRHVRAFAAFIGRSPAAATAEDLRIPTLTEQRPSRGLEPAKSAMRVTQRAMIQEPVQRQ
jgi:hypothetical protein